MTKTILTFKKDLTNKKLDSLSIGESFNREKKWWNYGLSSRINFGLRDIAYPQNTYQKDKFPMLIAFLESKAINLIIYSKRQSFLRYITNKEPKLRGNLDLHSSYISIDMFDDSFANFQNGYNNFKKLEINLQFDNEILEDVEKRFLNGFYPDPNYYDSHEQKDSLKVNFFTIRFMM